MLFQEKPDFRLILGIVCLKGSSLLCSRTHMMKNRDFPSTSLFIVISNKRFSSICTKTKQKLAFSRKPATFLTVSVCLLFYRLLCDVFCLGTIVAGTYIVELLLFLKRDILITVRENLIQVREQHTQREEKKNTASGNFCLAS